MTATMSSMLHLLIVMDRAMEEKRNVPCRRRRWEKDATSVPETLLGKRRNVPCRRRCWEKDATSRAGDIAGKKTQRPVPETSLGKKTPY
jgi:hypothetical protein